MPLLAEVRGLSIDLPAGAGRFSRVVDGVDLAVARGEIVGLVGESGSGKTLSTLALAGLLPEGAAVGAKLLTVAGVDVLKADESTLLGLRGAAVGYIFQEPAGALNPVRSVWYQVSEAARLRDMLSRSAARAMAERLLAEVGLEDPVGMAAAYPHQLSGGQRQRVLLAAALAGEPQLLVADEPTSALDPLAQARLVDLLVELCRRRGMALLFVSHDLALVGSIADRVTVMYAGETVECGRRDVMFDAPRHPYTRALVRALPQSGGGRRPPFPTIPGSPPAAGRWPSGCRFVPRCSAAFEPCRKSRPRLAREDERCVRCFLYPEEGDASE